MKLRSLCANSDLFSFDPSNLIKLFHSKCKNLVSIFPLSVPCPTFQVAPSLVTTLPTLSLPPSLPPSLSLSLCLSLSVSLSLSLSLSLSQVVALLTFSLSARFYPSSLLSFVPNPDSEKSLKARLARVRAGGPGRR